MPVPFTLRMLAAARQTYEIDGDGPAPVSGADTDVTGSGCIGWLPGGAPQGVLAGLFHQDAGMVGSIAEGSVVAIRGTTPFGHGHDLRQVLIDWASDAVATLEGAAGHPPGFPGRVHFGFYKAFMRLWNKLQPLVAQQVLAHPEKVIYVTGHSKGGAICPLVAWRLSLDFPDHQIVVRAFAPARIGNDDFAAAYNAKIPDHIRFEYDDDMVPHMPLEGDLITALGVPSLVGWLLSKAELDYGSVGTLAYIRQDGSICGDTEALEADRVARLIAKLETEDGLTYVASCHGIDASTDGYVKAAYAVEDGGAAPL
jgi:hypothetical protein